jgi:putative transposase
MKCRFSLSYRELEEIVYIRGAVIDHSTLQRWIMRFVPLLDTILRTVLQLLLRVIIKKIAF